MFGTSIQYFPVRHGGADHDEKIDTGSWVIVTSLSRPAGRLVWLCIRRDKAEQCIK